MDSDASLTPMQESNTIQPADANEFSHSHSQSPRQFQSQDDAEMQYSSATGSGVEAGHSQDQNSMHESNSTWQRPAARGDSQSLLQSRPQSSNASCQGDLQQQASDRHERGNSQPYNQNHGNEGASSQEAHYDSGAMGDISDATQPTPNSASHPSRGGGRHSLGRAAAAIKAARYGADGSAFHDEDASKKQRVR